MAKIKNRPGFWPDLLALFILCAGMFGAHGAAARVLTANEVWKGVVELKEDVLVPAGLVLTILPGTRIQVWAAEDTKIKPEFLSHRTEILVRGTLRAAGTKAAPIVFAPGGPPGGGRWSGIIVDGGEVGLRFCRLSGAQNGIYVLRGMVKAVNLTMKDNIYALIASGGKARLELTKAVITGNEYGLSIFNKALVRRSQTEISHNLRRDVWHSNTPHVVITPGIYTLADDLPLRRVYKNETIKGTTIWRDRVRITGQVRIAPKARLIIMPGTVVEFTRRDTNGDGIGENGILAQGEFIAKGTPRSPIIFRSAEKKRGRGDWDAINILGSDRSRNLIEFCQIEDAYRGLHFHFANVAVSNTILRHNYRGLQFQESLVEIRDCQFYDNKSAVQARDSEVYFNNNQVFANINGVNFFRQNLTAHDNIFANNQWDGLRIREGEAVIERNVMAGNRFGLLVANAVFGRFSHNLLAANLENGLSLRNTDSLTVSANAVLNNGLNGISIRDTRGEISGNLVAGNGERGIGIRSFSGAIKGNNIVANGVYAIGLTASGDVRAVDNWWGGADMARAVFDKHDNPALGLVSYKPAAPAPFVFTWPLARVPFDLSWYGLIRLTKDVTVPRGAALSIVPGTTVQLAKGVGMEVYGQIKGQGRPDGRIRFTSVGRKAPNSWGEIMLDRAMGSFFNFCDFEYAAWDIHCHFTNLIMNHCRFLNSYGGFRFRSGPVEIENSLFEGNHIGLRALIMMADIHNNTFKNNEMAIFIRRKGSGIKIHHNNFIDNRRYDIRVGDFDAEDVDARYNWWQGKTRPDKIFDGRRDPELGRVIYEPVELKKQNTDYR